MPNFILRTKYRLLYRAFFLNPTNYGIHPQEVSCSKPLIKCGLQSNKELIAITGDINIIQQILNQSINSMRFQFPQVSQVFCDEFSAGVNVDQLINRLIPIYDKYLIDEEIKQLISFYRTPVGEK